MTAAGKEQLQIAQLISVFVIHLFCAMMTAMEHNAMQFLSKFTVWDYHFFHFFFTFVCLSVLVVFGKVSRRLMAYKELLPIVLTKLCSSIGINLVANGSANGLLFLLRFTDVLVTVCTMLIAVKIFGFQPKCRRQQTPILMTLAVLASFSWFFPSFWHDHYSRLLFVPLAVITGALHNLFTYNQYQKLDLPFDTYLWNVSGASALALLLPVLGNKMFCFNCVADSANDGLQFELADYAIFVGAVLTMSGLIYTQYMLICHCQPLDYLALRHFKYSLAAVGQQIIQNLAYMNVINVASSLGSIVLGVWYLMDMKKTDEKTVLPV